jgi:glycosyltransferase involved in cell wall biosynthesis
MNELPPKFSLVVATIGRTAQLARLLETLRLQSCQSFEVIVVDQNPPGYLAATLAAFQSCFPILHLRSEPGLSRARNAALGHLRGEFVAFPDDDCWYPQGLLQSVARGLEKHPEWDGLTGVLADPAYPEGFSWFHKTGGTIDFSNLWCRSTSVTIFLRRTVVEKVGEFDENLGRGARTGLTSAEESDYLIRALLQGCSIFYSPDLRVFHRAWRSEDKRQIGLAFGDSRALGGVLRKYRYPRFFVLHKLTRSGGGMAWYALRGNLARARYHWHTFHGLLLGWLSNQWRPASSLRESSAGQSQWARSWYRAGADFEA